MPTFVHCGMKVTHSILVRNDLVDCLFDGLVVDADGITIDLDGHTLDGKGLGAGVRNKGFDNVTIKNGRIVDYDWGVALNTGTRRNVVENLRPEMTQEAAIGLGHIAEPDPSLPVEPPDPFPSADSGVRENIIRDNTIIGNKRGVWVTANAQHTLIKGNSFATTGDDAVWLERSHHNRVEHNEIDRARAAPASRSRAPATTSIADNDLETNNGGVVLDVTHTPPVDVQSNDNRVERNLIEESGGLEIIESDRNQLIENVVRRANDSGRRTRVRPRQRRQAATTCARTRAASTSRARRGNRIEANDASDSESTGISLESRLVRQRPDPQPVQQQRRRRHLHRRRGARGHRDADRGQRRPTTTRATASTSPSRPHHQGQQRQRQRQLGHLRRACRATAARTSTPAATAARATSARSTRSR